MSVDLCLDDLKMFGWFRFYLLQFARQFHLMSVEFQCLFSERCQFGRCHLCLCSSVFRFLFISACTLCRIYTLEHWLEKDCLESPTHPTAFWCRYVLSCLRSAGGQLRCQQQFKCFGKEDVFLLWPTGPLQWR